MSLELLVNGVVAILLLVTIGVATVLYVRLGRIRKLKGEMEALIQELARASGAAETSLRGFREMAESTGRDVEDRVRAGQALREELAFLIDRGAGIADRLATTPATRTDPKQQENAAGSNRNTNFVQAIRPRGRQARPERAAAPDAGIAHSAGGAEQALMRALESAR